MNLSVNQRSTCRVCGSHKLYKFLEFPDVPLVDDYLTADGLGSEFLYPLRIFVCEDCHLVQTQHDVDISGYYRDYHYSVASSTFAQQFMRALAKASFERYGLRAKDSVVEVGSSDGFQYQSISLRGRDRDLRGCTTSRFTITELPLSGLSLVKRADAWVMKWGLLPVLRRATYHRGLDGTDQPDQRDRVVGLHLCSRDEPIWESVQLQ